MVDQIDSSHQQKPIDRSLANFVTALFNNWKTHGVPFVVLRNYEALPEATSNDIDVLVLPEQLAQAEQLLIATAQESGFALHNRVEFMPVSLYFHHVESLQQIQIDLFHCFKWRGFNFLSPHTVMKARNEGALFATPHPAHEAVNNLLTRQIHHGYVKEDYKPMIRERFLSHGKEVQSILEEMFGPRLAKRLIKFVGTNNWKDAEAQSGAMRRQLIFRQSTRHPLRTIASLIADLKRLGQRFLRPPGLTIVLLGPDGSGKSTVGQKLVENLRNTFSPQKSLQLHWKPIVFFPKKRQCGIPTTNPHGKPPRHFPASLFFLGVHWLEYFLGAQLHLRPVTFRNGLVLADRYHYDFLVDPIRYRMKLPFSLLRGVFKIIPQPDLVFLLDAPLEILRSRKQEVSLEETQRQRDAYRTLVAGMPYGKIISSNQPPEMVVEEITRAVLNHLQSRQSSR